MYLMGFRQLYRSMHYNVEGFKYISLTGLVLNPVQSNVSIAL